MQIGPEILKTEPRLDEALKSAPGVSLFRRTGSGAANPTTQGLSLRAIAPSGAGRALVTLDGAPQNDPFGGWVIWSGLPSEGIEGATVVRGAGAGPYGAGALTGVVALQERATPDGLAAAEVSAGQRGSFRAALAAGVPGVLLTAAGSRSEGYYAVRGPRQGAADTRLRMDDASVALRLQREIAGVQTAVRLSGFQVNQQAGLKGARSNTSGASVAVTLAQPASEGVGGWRLQGWARASDLENSSVAVAANRATTTPANDQYDTPATGYGLNAALQGRQRRPGLGGRRRPAHGRRQGTGAVPLHERRLHPRPDGRRRDAGGGRLCRSGVRPGAAAADRRRARGPLAGLQRRAHRARPADRRGAAGPELAGPLGHDAYGPAGGTLRGGRGPGCAAAAYAGFRAPTLNELHRPFRVGNDITEANPTLKPETLQGIEAGLAGEWETTRWSAEVFYNLLKDPITNVTIGIGPGNFPDRGVRSGGRRPAPAPERRRDRGLGPGGRGVRRRRRDAELAGRGGLYRRRGRRRRRAPRS